MTPPPRTTRSLDGGNGPQLLGVGDRLPAQRAVPLHRVGAHPPQRRRVGVDGDRRRGAVLVHPVHVRGVEVERLPRAVADPARGAAEDQALLDQLALHHRDRAARDVVVVEPRVVAVGPGDHPDVDVVVAPQLLEVALRRVVADQRAPRLGLRGDAGDQGAQLGAVEHAHAATSTPAPLSSRCGLRSWIAARTASPSDSSRCATTGRSEPSTSWSTPISRTTASTARSPYEETWRNTPASEAARPPRAVSRSRCSGARPASIAKHTRKRGCALRPQARNAYQAVCMLAT